MDEAERVLFVDLLSYLKEIRDSIKSITNESSKDLKFLLAQDVADILHKNVQDVRELMRNKDFPAVPDKKGDLKVEEKAFIRWCRCEHISYDKEELKRILKTREE